MRLTRTILPCVAVLLVFVAVACGEDRADVRIGSKSFTESVILGEIATHLVRDTGLSVEHRREIVGTRILWQALLAGQLDAYPEYTGTLIQEILAGQSIENDDALSEALAEVGIVMVGPLGFNNTYAMGMLKDNARRLNVMSVSDLRKHPDLSFGFSNEFMARGDGWPGLSKTYGLTPANVRGLNHDLAYRSIVDGTLDVIDIYTTDAEIEEYGLAMLEDDLHYFPRYDAVFLVRDDIEPTALNALRKLSGSISQSRMVAMNARVKLHGEPETVVGAEFVTEELGVETEIEVLTLGQRLMHTTLDHLTLVGISLGAAILIAIPLGVVSAMKPGPGQVIIGACGIVQTIPSLALLVILMKPVRWAGADGFAAPAIVALFLYSLLPIVRNTATGITNVSATLRESATALGLGAGARMKLVELPLASPMILAGIKTSAVINVGFATLGALIGAGGYGQPIMTGIRLDDYRLILEGAVPAALLALMVQGLFELAERLLVPRGLRIRVAH